MNLPTACAAPAATVPTSLFRITVQGVHAHTKDNKGYRFQLCVGLRSSSIALESKTFIPMTLWDAERRRGASPSWWDADAMSMTVMPSAPIHWDACSVTDYIEVPKYEGRPYVDIHMRRVAMQSGDGGGELKNTTTHHAERIVLSNETEATTQRLHQLFAFDETVSMSIETNCVSNDEAMVLRADPDDQKIAYEGTTTDRTQLILLAEAAAAMKERAAKSLHGSRSHQLLSAWSVALETTGGEMVAVLSALPFGKQIVEAASGLFSVVMRPGAVVELGADVCGQTALLLRVLTQPLVREIIIAEVSTHSLLERLLGTMEDTVRILEEYNKSRTVARLWNAGSRLDLLQKQSTEMHNIFTLLHQLLSFHAQTTHVHDTRKMLQVVGSTQLLTADNLAEHLLPQLVASVDQMAATTDAAIGSASATTTSAIEAMLEHLLKDITTMTSRQLEAQCSNLQTMTRDAVRDEVLSVMSAVALSGSQATMSVLSQSMRGLLNDVVHNVLPSMMKSAVSTGLKEQLEGVVGSAWLSALQQEIRTACTQVQAHTPPAAVRVPLIQLGSQSQPFQERLGDASTAAAEAVQQLERTMHESLEMQIGGAEQVVRNEAVSVRAAIEMTHHSLSGKIAVLHVEVSGLFGELHLQRRVLDDVRVKLDSMYERTGATLKKQLEITEVLDVLPDSVRKAFSGDIQRLHRQLQRCGLRAKDYIKRLLDYSVSRIVASYNEHQALQRRHQRETDRYLSQLLQQQREITQHQLSNQQLHHIQHKEHMDNGSAVLGTMNRRFDQIERMISMLQSNRYGHVSANRLLYDPREDDGLHLTYDQRRYYAGYSLQLLQVELRTVYHELDATETSIMGHSIKFSRMGMYTALRIVHVPSAMTHRGTAAESYEGGLMESTEVLSVMKLKGWKSLLVEGRAGIGKTTWAIHLSQLQNFADGVVILLKLSEVAKHLEMRHSRDFGVKLSPRELLYISFGATPSNAALVELVFYKMRHCDNKTIVWLVDGFDEVISNTNLILQQLIDAVSIVTSGTSTESTHMFGQHDIVVVASREERGGLLSASQFVATINPWTEAEAVCYVKKYFSQPGVRDAVDAQCTLLNKRDIAVCIDDAVRVISEKRLGALSTLPIVLEMLCWCATNGVVGIDSIVSLYKRAIDTKLKSAKFNLQNSTKPWESSIEDLIALCVSSSIKTRNSVFFEIDATNPICRDLLRSGLVREQLAVITEKTVVRFVHKSFLEYFRALYFSTNIHLLDTTLCDDPVTTPCEDGVECVVFSSPDDILRIENPNDGTVIITLVLKCLRDLPTSFDVIWLVGVDEREKYEVALNSTFAPRYLPKNDVTCTWDCVKEPTKSIEHVSISKRSEVFLVIQPKSGTGIVPVSCRWLYSAGSVSKRPLVLSNRVPLCDIPGHRQQRNFFLFLTAFLSSIASMSRRQDLLQYLLRRLQYHHPRAASFMSPDDRSLVSPIFPSGGATFTVRPAHDGRSKAQIVSEMCLSIVTECAATLLPTASEFHKHLEEINERSSKFGRLKEYVGLRPKAIFEWALLPCARYGTWEMWVGLESHIPKECLNFFSEDASLWREALVAAITHERHDIEEGLCSRQVTLDLGLASRLGATDLVLREVEKVIEGGNETSIDDTFLLTMSMSLSTLQLDTAAALWDALAVVSTNMPKVWALTFSSYAVPHGRPLETCDGKIVLPAAAVSWLRDCFVVLPNRLSLSQRDAAEQCLLKTGLYDAIQAAIPLGLVTIPGLLDGYQQFLTDANIDALIAAACVIAPTSKHTVRCVAMTRPSQKQQTLAHTCCTFTTTRFIILSDCDTSFLQVAFTECAGTLEELQLTKCSPIPSLGAFARLRKLSLAKCVIDVVIAEAIPLLLFLEDLSIETIYGDIAYVRFVLTNIRSSLRSLTLANVDVGMDDLSSHSISQLLSLTISNSRCMTDEGIVIHAAPGGRGPMPHLAMLNLSNCEGVTDAVIRRFGRLPHLTTLDLGECSKVTDAALRSLGPMPSLTTLNLKKCRNVTDAGIGCLGRLPQLTFLDLGECNVTNSALRSIGFTPHLEQLSLQKCQNVTDAGLGHLGPLPQLTILDLSECSKVADGALRGLGPMPRLTTLNLCLCYDVTDLGLGHLGPLPLTILDLSECSKVSDATLRVLGLMPHLKKLSLRKCHNVTDAGVGYLGPLPQLELLDLCECSEVTDAALRGFGLVPHLELLNLKKCQNVTDAGIRYLGPLPQLTFLGLGRMASDVSLRALGPMPHLTTLGLYQCNDITELGISHLGPLPQLIFFELAEHKATDTALRVLGLMPQLTTLSLYLCHDVTDLGIAHLGPLSQLEVLDLVECSRVTDAALRGLGPMPHLEKVNLKKCRHLTDAGIGCIGPLPRLTFLDLGECRKVTGAALWGLGATPHLEQLSLRKCQHLTDASIRSLGPLPQLKFLDLDECSNVTDAAFRGIGPTPHLTTLSVDNCQKVTDAGIGRLGPLPKLTFLGLGECKAADSALWYLGSTPHLTTLRLNNCDDVTDLGIAYLGPLSQLKVLDLGECSKVTDAALRVLGPMPRLKKLDLTKCRNVTDAGIGYLGHLPQLTFLDLGECSEVTDSALRGLGSTPHLELLSLKKCQRVTDTGIRNLGPLAQLAFLGLGECSKVTDTALRSLGPMPHLATLSLYKCKNVTDFGIGDLGPHPLLTILDLNECSKVTDGALKAVGPVPHLRKLNLTKCQNVTDAGIGHLGPLPQLIVLDLGECNEITDDALRSLGSTAQLEQLNLKKCQKVTDAGISSLGPLPKLTFLGLGECKAADAALKGLGSTPHLTTLRLNNCDDVTDLGIAYLGPLSQLKVLDLGECSKVTDAALRVLGPMPRLKKLNLRKCRNVTDAGIRCFGPLSQLTVLDLRECSKVTDTALRGLGTMPHLQTFS